MTEVFAGSSASILAGTAPGAPTNTFDDRPLLGWITITLAVARTVTVVTVVVSAIVTISAGLVAFELDIVWFTLIPDPLVAIVKLPLNALVVLTAISPALVTAGSSTARKSYRRC